MQLIPAIDIKGGQCVRLNQGDMSKVTVFASDPAQMARHWVDLGAKRLHLVDLDGAKAGKPVNSAAIHSILQEVNGQAPVQLGGGIRDLDTIEHYLDLGLDSVILGTAAVKNPAFLREACTGFGRAIIAALDARAGKVMVDGWSRATVHNATEWAQKFVEQGVETLIYTDTGRDGMLSGLNIAATAALARSIGINVIASGGLSGMADLEALSEAQADGIGGVICGMAIYTGKLDFKAALQRFDPPAAE